MAFCNCIDLKCHKNSPKSDWWIITDRSLALAYAVRLHFIWSYVALDPRIVFYPTITGDSAEGCNILPTPSLWDQWAFSTRKSILIGK